ncbi:O-antigen ligase family protein [Sphingomonas citricola]|uniref:O-antigen ligase family protein n=1 Tax=Sphingomonas citricola TaxID=2862498 RepID=UPI001C67BADD|nr:O-antigen ligase family protein [Sphingomonas citricola]
MRAAAGGSDGSCPTVRAGRAPSFVAVDGFGAGAQFDALADVAIEGTARPRRPGRGGERVFGAEPIALIPPRRLRQRPRAWPVALVTAAVTWVAAVGLQPLQDRADFVQYAVVDQRLYMPFYLGLAALALVAWLRLPAFPRQLIDPLLLGFLLWAAVTVMVAPEPARAALNWGKQVAYLLGVGALVTLAPSQRLLVRVLAATLLAIVAIDLVAVVIRPDVAVHQASDAVEPTLAGLWRGLHPHKAKFGEALAFAFLLTQFEARARHERWRLVLLPLLVLVMVAAGAKTSLLALALALVTTAALTRVARHVPGPVATVVAAPFVAVAGVGIAALVPVLLADLFGDVTLAGRTRLWAFLWHYAAAHPLAGSGFMSFFVGEGGPLFRSGDALLMRMGNAHNSFLDLLVTTGWPGAMLGCLALVVAPVARAYRRLPDDRFARLWVTVLLFGGISSLTSVTLLQTERAAGLMMTLAYAGLRLRRPVAADG